VIRILSSFVFRLSFLVFLPGCSGYIGTARPFDPATAPKTLDWLEGIEVVRQRHEDDCGPAALTMVLRWHERATTLDEMARECPPREGGGVTAGALQNAARAKGLKAHVVAGTIDDLREQIAKGRPVIVGLVKPHLDRARPHFEVVAGIDRDEQVVITIDPARGWTWNTYEGFLAEWEPAGRPLLIVAAAAK
jgi:ABC-type bacteriocin/lantibiotic exporter with double-glycine peptidase domain